MWLTGDLPKKIYSNSGNPLVLAAMPSGARTILDLGFGAGDNARHLQRRVFIVDGITLSAGERTPAGPYCRHVIVWNLEEGLPNELADSYDVCICSHVLEHICWPEALLRGIHAKIRSHGRVIVALPNLMMWRYRIPLALGKFEYSDTGVMDRTHFRWYTVQSARQLFSALAFALNGCSRRPIFH